MDFFDVAPFQWRSSVALALIAAFPVSVSADDAEGRAMLRSNGAVLVNNREASVPTTVFPGDEIENRSAPQATIDYEGSRVEIAPETLIKLESGGVELEHGSVIVTSFRQFQVRAGCVVATPVTADKTVFAVRDTDNRVLVNARERDVNLDAHTKLKHVGRPGSFEHAVVHQGEERSRQEHCGAGNTANAPGATGAPMDSVWAIGAASLVPPALICYALCRSGRPLSQSDP